MAIVYTKTDQGLTVATGTGAPVHTAVAGDRYTDTANGNTYQYTTSWQIISYGAGTPSWLESNATDLTIWNYGKGNVATNTSFGDLALAINSTGSNNTSIGYNTLYNNQGGTQNTAIGSNALSGNISSNFNTGIGYGALFTNGSSDYNTAIGFNSLT